METKITSEHKNYLKSASKIALIGPLLSDIKLIESTSAEAKIFVDGGQKFNQNQEGFSIGDGDSYNGKLDYIFPEDKNLSDLALALQCIPPTVTKLYLLGFLGGRRDHELINLGECFQFIKQHSHIECIIFDQEIFLYPAGKHSHIIHGSFSIFSFENCDLSIKGNCKYPLNPSKQIPAGSSHLLSNSANGKIEIEAKQTFFLISTTEN